MDILNVDAESRVEVLATDRRNEDRLNISGAASAKYLDFEDEASGLCDFAVVNGRVDKAHAFHGTTTNLSWPMRELQNSCCAMLHEILQSCNEVQALPIEEVWSIISTVLEDDVLSSEQDPKSRFWMTKLAYQYHVLKPTTRVAALDCVAAWYHSKGRVFEAQTLLRLALTEKEALFGRNTPMVISNRVQLARWHKEDGQLEKSEQQLLVALQSATVAYGHAHSVTTRLLKWTAAILERQHKLEELRHLLQAHIASIEEEHGFGHEEALELLSYLGNTLVAHSRFAAAQETFNTVLTAREIRNGADHIQTLRAAVTLGRAYSFECCHWHLYKAETLYKRALAGISLELGTDAREVIILRLRLARIYRNQGREDQVRNVLESWCQRWVKCSGPQHPEVYTIFALLGHAYIQEGELMQAAPLLCRGLGHKDNTALSIVEQIGVQLHKGDLVSPDAEAIFKTIFPLRNVRDLEPWIRLRAQLTLIEAARHHGDHQKARKHAHEILKTPNLSEHPNLELGVLANLAFLQSNDPWDASELWHGRTWTDHIIHKWHALDYTWQTRLIDTYYYAVYLEIAKPNVPRGRRDHVYEEAEVVYYIHSPTSSSYCTATFNQRGILAEEEGDIAFAEQCFKRAMRPAIGCIHDKEVGICAWADSADRLERIYQSQGRHDLAGRISLKRGTIRCKHLRTGAFEQSQHKACKKSLTKVMDTAKIELESEPETFTALLEILRDSRYAGSQATLPVVNSDANET
ncbi:hypothetical protein BDV96DRAFT_309352 [Lophiotrema nucula]|uniref:Uncharacterized protein n=1 Tax=Lophiotrema nucula TaxID=690887 RepID=A0A6A5YLA1_9PLEO|nr:hypothetical protein BDV96DRAFT_309352 [Lophiotrema nucula]